MRRTNAAIWQDKYRRWKIDVQRDGVRRSFYASAPGRNGQRECHKKADEWLDGNLINAETRAKVLHDKWIAELKTTTGRGHWTNYESFWNNWIGKKIDHIKMGKLTEQNLQDVITSAHKAGLAKETLSDMRSCMSAFIKYGRKCKATGLIVENVSIPRSAPVGKRTILQPRDIKALFSRGKITMWGKEAEDEFINAYRFEVATGLRPGELIGLKWSDISGNQVNLKRSINKFGEETRGKNDNARRSFMLTPIAQGILKQQRTHRSTQKIISDFVFPNKLGEYVPQRTYYARWAKYRKAAGIIEVTPYELRHTFVSMVKTLPEGLLKQLVGHSKDMDTYGTYSHEVDGDMDQAASMVQNLLSSVINK
jgi:integrase